MRSAEEWARRVNGHVGIGRCNRLGDACSSCLVVAKMFKDYAREVGEAVREEAARKTEAFEREVVKKVSISELEDILSRQDQPSVTLLPSGEVSVKEKPMTLHVLAAAIRQIEVETP